MLSGQGLVSRITGSRELPLSAYRIRTPPTVWKRTCGVVVIGMDERRLRGFRRARPVVAGFDGLDRLLQRPIQHALAEDREHDPERPSLEVLALAYHDDVQVGRPVGPPRERIGVARVA